MATVHAEERIVIQLWSSRYVLAKVDHAFNVILRVHLEWSHEPFSHNLLSSFSYFLFLNYIVVLSVVSKHTCFQDCVLLLLLPVGWHESHWNKVFYIDEVVNVRNLDNLLYYFGLSFFVQVHREKYCLILQIDLQNVFIEFTGGILLAEPVILLVLSSSQF